MSARTSHADADAELIGSNRHDCLSPRKEKADAAKLSRPAADSLRHSTFARWQRSTNPDERIPPQSPPRPPSNQNVGIQQHVARPDFRSPQRPATLRRM